jgi:hypothetical protein
MSPSTENRRKRCKLCRETGHNKLACPFFNASLSPPISCSWCGQPDHTGRSCPDKPRPSKVTCSLCGQDSHNCRTCPLNPKRKEKRTRRTSATTDTGAGSAPPRQGTPITTPGDLAVSPSGVLPQCSTLSSDNRATSIVQRMSTRHVAPSKDAPHATQLLVTPRTAADAAIPLTAGGSGLLDRRLSNAREMPAVEGAFAMPPSRTSVKLGNYASALPETVEDAIQLAAAASHRCDFFCVPVCKETSCAQIKPLSFVFAATPESLRLALLQPA